MKAKLIKRVILAVDLKAEEPKLTNLIWDALKPILIEKNVVIEPVAVLGRQDAALGKSLSGDVKKYQAASEKHLGEKLAKMGIHGLAAPKVLFANGSTTRRCVEALLAHAKKTKCDVIGVSSHARKGLSRAFLGSFAETLALQSSVPLLIVNPKQKSFGKVKTILFPTDFSPSSKKGLEAICASFQKEHPKFVLFHSYLPPVLEYMDLFLSYPPPQDAIDKEFKRMEQTSAEWVKEFKQNGIEAEVVIDRKSNFVSEGILSTAKKKKAELIAMVSSSSGLESKLLGSVTRQVIRDATIPVWVIRIA